MSLLPYFPIILLRGIDQFVTEARKMHEGDVPERAIRGSATAQEYQELREEGIAVVPIPEFMNDDKLN